MFQKAFDIDKKDRLFHVFLISLSTLVLGLFVVLVSFLFKQSWPAIRDLGFSALTNLTWAPNLEKFTLVPFIVGTLSTSLLALCIAIPISVTTALYITELSPPWIRGPFSFLVEMLAAIPSVVYGLSGECLPCPLDSRRTRALVTIFLWQSTYFSGPIRESGVLCAGMLLAIMIVPTITTVCREVFKSVPREIREGALALGATHTEMIHEAVIKSSTQES